MPTRYQHEQAQTKHVPLLGAQSLVTVALSMYLFACVCWLLLGLVPPLSSALPPLHHEMTSLATGGGAFAVYAHRILMDESGWRHGGWVIAEYMFSLLNLALGILLLVHRRHQGPRRTHDSRCRRNRSDIQ
jgi:hypothetical protein